MIDRSHALADELRRMRVPVSTSDLISAAEALAVTDLTDRDAVREALAANFAKTAEHRDAFDLLFELYFAPSATAAPSFGTIDDEQLRLALDTALKHQNRHMLREIAATAVERYARIEPGRRAGGTFYILRTLQGLGVAEMPAPDGRDAEPPHHLGTLGRELATHHARRAAEMFERIVESEVRRRLVADRGADAVAATLRHPLPEDADFLTASDRMIEQMVRVIAPLSQQLARQLARNGRSAPRRRLDIRRTIRASLSTGGIAVRLHLLPRRTTKPRLVIITDISGSVAGFAAFALQLIYALRARFTRFRAFVFADSLDEVTDLIAENTTITATTSRINSEGRGVRLDGRSDYGNALGEFAEQHLATLDNRTIVLILGDARSNYRDPHPDALKAIRARAGAVFWLNPESAALWNDGDAVTGVYAPHCDAVVECRTIRQLKAFVADLE